MKGMFEFLYFLFKKITTVYCWIEPSLSLHWTASNQYLYLHCIFRWIFCEVHHFSLSRFLERSRNQIAEIGCIDQFHGLITFDTEILQTWIRNEMTKSSLEEEPINPLKWNKLPRYKNRCLTTSQRGFVWRRWRKRSWSLAFHIVSAVLTQIYISTEAVSSQNNEHHEQIYFAI